MEPMTIQAVVDEYVAFRRSVGVALRIEGQLLQHFARFADQIGHRGPVTTDLAVRWAKLPSGASAPYHAQRLDIIRRLARHRAPFDVNTEIPAEGLLGPSSRRGAPHIYTQEQVAALMKAASELRSNKMLRAHTYTVLFGLLACTGMRISEALRLTRSDVDLEAGVITIRAAKFQTSRLVPTHELATPALRAYAEQRDRRVIRPRSDAFFLSESGTSLRYITVHHTFDRLRHQLGWKSGRQQRAPRIHDLRHTFAVSCLIRWYEQGAEINHKIASLSTYLGHTDVSSTYWYLSAVPELLALAAVRFESGAPLSGAGGVR
jgi:integrase